jgi:hypothetical protein
MTENIHKMTENIDIMIENADKIIANFNFFWPRLTSPTGARYLRKG